MNPPLPSKKDPHATTLGVAEGGGPPYDGDMELRIENLETGVSAIRLDIEIIKATGATKSDLSELKAATKQDIVELRAETKQDIAELRVATKQDIAELRTATKQDIAELKVATEAQFAEARAATKVEIAELRAELKALISEAKTSIIMWVTSAIFLAQLLPALLQHFTR